MNSARSCTSLCESGLRLRLARRFPVGANFGLTEAAPIAGALLVAEAFPLGNLDGVALNHATLIVRNNSQRTAEVFLQRGHGAEEENYRHDDKSAAKNNDLRRNARRMIR